MTAAGRLLRQGPDGWQPVGEPLPPFAHAPPAPTLQVAPWVLPREPAPAVGDVVVVGELAHRLVARCEPDDPIVDELAQQTMLFHGAEAATAWLAEVEVWIGFRLDGGWQGPGAGRG